MNNQDKRFWSEFPEDELKDPADKQVLAALRDIYRIDEDDQQSVERAWQRISSSIDQSHVQQQKRTSRLNGRYENPAYFSLMGAKNIAHIQRSSMRRRLDTLVALGIVFLLIGSMLGILAYRQAMSSNQTGKGAPVSTQKQNTPMAQKRLGTSLGEMYLGMPTSFLAQHGIQGTFLPAVENNQSVFQCFALNCQVLFKEDLSSGGVGAVQKNPSLNSVEAVQIKIWKGFSGTTTEGFRIGMPLSMLNVLYKDNQFQRTTFKIPDFRKLDTLQQISLPQFIPLAGPGTLVSIKDAYGITLWVAFYNQQAVQIILQSSAIKDTVPTATPDTKTTIISPKG